MSDNTDGSTLEPTIDQYLTVVPPRAATGHELISQLAAAMLSQFPSQTFRRASDLPAA